jgi:hypothetical protein
MHALLRVNKLFKRFIFTVDAQNELWVKNTIIYYPQKTDKNMRSPLVITFFSSLTYSVVSYGVG